MTPNLGQGANSAMVDALVLVRLLHATLDAGGSLDDVGRRYQTIRRPFVRRLQAASRVDVPRRELAVARGATRAARHPGGSAR